MAQANAEKRAKERKAYRRKKLLARRIKANALFFCPYCEASVPTAESEQHLKEHEAADPAFFAEVDKYLKLALEIQEILESVDQRCAAADGAVTPSDSNYFKSMPKEPLIQGWAEIIRTEFFKAPPVMFGFKTVEEWEKFTKFAASSSLLPVEHEKWIEAIQQALGNMGRIGDRDYFSYCMWLVFDQAEKDGLMPADPRTSQVLAELAPKISTMKSKLASLPVGESRDLHSIMCQAVTLLNQGDTLKAHTLLRETLAEYVA